VGKALALPRVLVVGTRASPHLMAVVANPPVLLRLPHRYPSNFGANKEPHWETWCVPRFSSSKLASHEPVTAIQNPPFQLALLFVLLEFDGKAENPAKFQVFQVFHSTCWNQSNCG
jgi:hypothetical protein